MILALRLHTDTVTSRSQRPFSSSHTRQLAISRRFLIPDLTWADNRTLAEKERRPGAPASQWKAVEIRFLLDNAGMNRTFDDSREPEQQQFTMSHGIIVANYRRKHSQIRDRTDGVRSCYLLRRIVTH